MMRLLLLALAACGAAACGNDTREPPAELIEFEPAREVRKIWDYRAGGGTERLRLGLRPAVDPTSSGDRGPRLFVGSSDGNTAALDLETGAAIWEADTDRRLSAGPGYGDGVVVFGTADGGLLALQAETGDELWYRGVGSEVLATPAVGRGAVIYRTTDGRLSAVAIGDGSERWTVSHSAPTLTLRGNSAPLIAGDLTVAGFDSGRIGVYVIDTGATRWEDVLATPTGRTELDRLVDVGTDIAVFGGSVYAATYQGRAGAFTLTTGTPLWEQNMSSFVGLGVDTDHVYVTNDVGTVFALNRVNRGIEVWRQDALRLRDVTAATRFEGTVVVGDFEGYLHWLDARDGSFVARARVSSGQITAQPLAVGPRVVVQSEDGRVAAFEIVEEIVDEAEETDESEETDEPGDADESG